MTRIKLSHPFRSRYLTRQTPGSRGVWEDCIFFIDEEVEECDYWVVYEGLKRDEHTRCSPQNTIIITGEPPSIKDYNPRFLAQFGTVITCNPNINHSHVILGQQSQPWHAGIVRTPERNSTVKLNYDDFQNINYNQKDKLISVICSMKSATMGHRQRLRFVDHLRKHFNGKLDIFGRGFNPIPDKWDAIYPYKYHIALENSSIQDYWTEKLSDAFLGLAYPIYYGCTNISSYFPSKSFSSIDIYDPEKAISVIEEIIENRTYEKSMKYILEAKSLVLNQYNLFPMLASVCHDLKVNPSTIESVRLKPESSFVDPFSKICRLIRKPKV
jgi:hypothetical protein